MTTDLTRSWDVAIWGRYKEKLDLACVCSCGGVGAVII